MKWLCTTIFLLLIALQGYSQTIQNYSDEKAKSLLMLTLKNEGHFRLALVPYSIEMAVVSTYPKWLEKRFNKDRMIKEARTLASQSEGKLYAILMISFTGDWQSTGKTDIKLPDDFAEYVFVENEQGTSYSCSKADVPLMGSSVNFLNATTQVTLEFSVADDLFSGADKLIFTIGGIGLSANQFVIDLPISAMYQDCSPDIRAILVGAGIWND